MRLLLDAGAFIAVERGDVTVAALLQTELRKGRVPLTHGGIVGQVWRGGTGRQVLVARLLAGVEVVPLDEALGRQAGLLLRAASQRDVVDAALITLARHGDLILTSDPDDLARLAQAAGVDVDLLEV